MDKTQKEKFVNRKTRKTVFGIKLPPIEADNGSVKTVLDVDPQFYTLVEGRPIRSNTSISKYKQDIKDVALKRTLQGILIDEIIRIDREFETERHVCDTAYKHFEECQHSFNKFLAYDNDKTIAVMQKSDALAKELANHTEAHKKANHEMASFRSKLQYINDTLMILLSFETFLHKSAPILWQQKEKINLDVRHFDVFTVETDIFQSININEIQERLNTFAPVRLYFENPSQLVTVFDLLEKQNTNYLLLTEEFNSEKNKFLKAVDCLKKNIKSELSYIEQKIKELEQIISWNTLREEELKEVFFRILEEKIAYLVSSKMVLQIFNHVEYAYEKLIAPNDIGLSSLDMVSAIKSEYENLLLDLTKFDLKLVKDIEKETFESGVKEIKQAKEANKLLKDVDKLSRRLKSSYEPSRRNMN